MKAILFVWILISRLQAETPLFFSLGSNCEIASVLSYYNLRHKSGPLDWVLTLDYDCFILLLENDFEGFVDERFLTQYPDTHVINSLYNIDFRHDWPDLDFANHLPVVQSTLQRRINRLLALKDYRGKVLFIRGAFDTNVNPFLPSITKECTKITQQDAKKIRDVLYRKYPDLDFTLVIINYDDEFVDSFDLKSVLEFKVSKSDRKKEKKTTESSSIF